MCAVTVTPGGVPERVVRRQRLGLEHVERRRRSRRPTAPRAERARRPRCAAPDVDQMRVRLHRGEHVGVDQAAGRVGERRGQHQVVAPADVGRRGRRWRRPHRSRGRRRGVRPAPRTSRPTARSSRAVSRPMAPVPTTRAARRRCCGSPGAASLGAVAGRGLVQLSLACASTAPSDVLGDRPVEHPASVGHDHVGLAQFVEQQRVDPGRGDVDPLQRSARSQTSRTAVEKKSHRNSASRALDGGGQARRFGVPQLDAIGHRDPVAGAPDQRSHSTATTGRVRDTVPRLGTNRPIVNNRHLRCAGRSRPDWAQSPFSAAGRGRGGHCPLRFRPRPRAVAMDARRRHAFTSPERPTPPCRHRRAGASVTGRGGRAQCDGPDRGPAPGHGLRLHVGQLRGRARGRARSGVVHAGRGRFGRRHDQRRAGRGAAPPRASPGWPRPLRTTQPSPPASTTTSTSGVTVIGSTHLGLDRAHLDGALRRGRGLVRRGRGCGGLTPSSSPARTCRPTT